MADQANFDKPDATSSYSSEVLETFRASIKAALAWLPGSRTNPGTGAVRRSTPSAGELLLETSNDATGSAWSTLFDSRTKVNKVGDTMSGSLVLSGPVTTRVEIQDSGDGGRGGFIATSATAFLVGSNSGVRPVEIAPDNVVSTTFAVGGAVGIGGATGLGTGNKLSVYGLGVFGNTSAPQMLIGNAGDGYGLLGTYNNYDAVVRANNANMLRVTPGGVVQMESGASLLRMMATTPKIEHNQSGTAIAELAFSSSGSRGTISLTTRTTAGASAVNVFRHTGTSTLLSTSTGTTTMSLVDGQTTFIVGSLTPLLIFENAVAPGYDNGVVCGGNGFRWSSVWAANGTIQTSDLTDKTDIAPIDGALATKLVKGLSPILFRWLVGGQKVERVEDGFDEAEIEVEEKYLEDVQEPVTEEVEVDHIEEQLEMVGAHAVRRLVPVKKKEQRPVGTWVPVVDEHGTPLMRQTGTQERTVGRGLNKRKVSEPVMEHVQHFVPTLRTVQVERTRTVKRVERTPRYKTITHQVPGKRLHAGFGAQDIKSLMDRLGIDCGLWVLDAQGKQHMRPDQLIPFLAAALASALDRLDKLEGGTPA